MDSEDHQKGPLQLSSASLPLPSLYKFSQVWLKKQETNEQLELHIKIPIIVPRFFSFLFFGLNRTHTRSSSPVLFLFLFFQKKKKKVRKYKVIEDSG